MYKLSFLIMSFVLAVSSAQATPTITFNNNNTKLSLGGVTTVDLLIQAAPQMEGGGVTLHYDPEIIEVIGVSIDAETWEFANNPGVIDNVSGTVSGILFSSYKGVSGEANIATVNIRAIGRGTSRITIEEAEENPFASNGNRFKVEFKRAKITVRSKK